jgi:hypothetical protein
MPDQWDPKYPVQSDDWDKLYPKVTVEVQKENSAWMLAFDSILAAEQAGEFMHLERFRSETARKHDVWVWRWGLWDLHCRPIFERPQEEWPQYARDVRAAEPIDPRNGGSLVGVPAPWDDPVGPHQNPDGWRTVWAFKATVLLIAGRIERKVWPLQRGGNRRSARPVPTPGADAAGLPGLGDMKPLLEELVREMVRDSVANELRQWRCKLAGREDG